MVLHQGPGTWTIPQLVELFHLPPELAAIVGAFTPAFDVALLDLGAWTPERILSLPPGLPRLGLAVLKAARTDADLVETIVAHAEDAHVAVAAGLQATVKELVRYTAWVRDEAPDERYRDRIRRALLPEDREAIMGEFLLSDELRARECAAAEVRGRVEEARRLLERQMLRRFPGSAASLQERLAGASLVELERWADQFVGASTPDQVFAEPSPPS